MSNANANLVICQASTAGHVLKFQQVDKDLHISFEESAFKKIINIDSSADNTFHISRKVTTQQIVDSIDLSQLIQTPSLTRKLITSLLFSRPEYDGDEDMVSSYASDFTKALICN